MPSVLFNASMYTKKSSGVGIHAREIWNHISENEEKTVNDRCFAYTKENLERPASVFLIKIPAINFLFSRFLSVHRLIWNIFYLPFIAKKHDLVYSFSSHGSPFIKNQVITIHDLICFEFPKQHRF